MLTAGVSSATAVDIMPLPAGLIEKGKPFALVPPPPLVGDDGGLKTVTAAVTDWQITINANPGDKINIIGVVLDGTFLASTNGIQFNSGGSLTVRDSVIRNFAQFGIFFEPRPRRE